VKSITNPSQELGEVELRVPIPTKSDWTRVTQRDVKDFLEEIKNGDTIFPSLPQFLSGGQEEDE